MIKSVKILPAGIVYKFNNGVELEISKMKEDSGWVDNVKIYIHKDGKNIIGKFFPNAEDELYISSAAILMLMDWIDKTQEL